jgi:acyl carrier protein
MPTEPDITAAIVAVLSEVAPDADLTDLDPGRSFRDQLEIDSVDFLNLVLGLEERLDVQIPESDYPKLSSLRGAAAYLTAMVHSGAAR